MKTLIPLLCLILAGCATQPVASPQVDLMPPGFTNSPAVIHGPILMTQVAAPATNAFPMFILPPVIYSPTGQSYTPTSQAYYRPVAKVEYSTDGVTWAVDTNFPAGSYFSVTTDQSPQKLWRITPQ